MNVGGRASARRGRAAGGARQIRRARHAAGGELRPHHAAGEHGLRRADRARLADRRRSPVVQVVPRPRRRGDAAPACLLRPRHPRRRAAGRRGRLARRPLRRQPTRHRRAGHPLLCRRAPDDGRRSQARHPVRDRPAAAQLRRRAAADAGRPRGHGGRRARAAAPRLDRRPYRHHPARPFPAYRRGRTAARAPLWSTALGC